MNSHHLLVEALSEKLARLFSASVECVETHISTVFLVADEAFKLKKPVNFGFLDFSTLTQRHFYCQEELRLNRRLAPELYLEVLAVTGSVERPELNGDGEVVDYLLHMRRFASDAEFSRLIGQKLPVEYIDQLADVIGGFHLTLPAAEPSAEAVAIERVTGACLENFSQIESSMHLLDAGQRKALQQLSRWTQDRLAASRPILESRLQQGFVRECHGDLHLGNITLFHGQVTVFDGIEFNEAFRWIDVISDLAFLVMDLHYHGHPEFATRLLNRYLEQTGDYAGLSLLSFYLVYRAMVRAKVAVLRKGQLLDEGRNCADCDQSLTRHLQLALTFIRPQPLFLMITFGVSGSGKSYLSAQKAEQTTAVRIRSDVERQRLFKDAGKRYAGDARQQVYDDMLQLAERVLKAGFPVILDATFLQAHNRRQAMALAQSVGVDFIILEASADVAELEKRIRQRQRDGQDASEADIAVMHQQLQSLEPLSEAERQFLSGI